MKRTIVPETPFFSEEIAPGVVHRSFYPGGKDGPNGEVLNPNPGGQTWTDVLIMGGADDPFQLMLPDIRMPANQYWPLHWHDCWTVVLVVEGECCIGDWWMKPGDIFITVPSLEYGPLLIGPRGCRLFEIFAQAHLAAGGYAPEYHDHPTLAGSQKVFLERSALNKRNEGRQVMPCDGVDGIWKSHLAPGALWDLGDPGDPDRGVMQDRRLAAGERVAAHSYGDWHGIFVMAGSFTIAGRTLGRDDYLLVAPGSTVGEIVAGEDGAQLLQLARTVAGIAEHPSAEAVSAGAAGR